MLGQYLHFSSRIINPKTRLNFRHISPKNITINFSLKASSSNVLELKKSILKETAISDLHLTPELKFCLVTPETRLWNSHSSKPFAMDPYWAFYWPGGQGLSRFLLDNGNVVENKRILDFGCGCGACGLSALKKKSKSVLFNDIDEVALLAVQENASLNKIAVQKFSSFNLIGEECPEIDVVLVGDMLYDAEFAEEVLQWLSKLSKNGKKVLIGDPGRFGTSSHPLKTVLRCIGKYRLPESSILENSGFSEAFVWELKE